MQPHVAVSMWLLTTLVPNILIGWKQGGWYWRGWLGSGQYAGRKWAVVIWFLWILFANYLIYPTIEQATASAYAALPEYTLLLFLVILAAWVHFFIWKGEPRREL